MTETTSSLRDAFKTAFSDGVYLPDVSQRDAFRGKYRNAFASPFQYIKDGRQSWPGVFDALDAFLYDSSKGLASAIKADIEARLTKYDAVVKMVDGLLELHAKYGLPDKSVTGLERRLMESFTAVSILSSTLTEELAKSEKCVQHFNSNDIDKMVKDVQENWSRFAFDVTYRKNNSALPQNVDFFPDLSDWAVVCNKLDRTASVLKKVGLKLSQVANGLKALSKVLQSLAVLSLDIYGNLGAGAQGDVESDLAEEADLVQQLRLWRESQPVLRKEDYAAKQVMKGEILHERSGDVKRFGDDLSLATGRGLVLDGIKRLDVSVSQDIWIDKKTDGGSDRYWKPEGLTSFFSSTLGWAQVPEAVRSQVRYGELELDLRGDRKVEWRDFSVFYMTTILDVKFDKPFETDDVDVEMWIQGFDVNRNQSEVSLKVERRPDRNANRNGFTAWVSARGGSLKYARFAYLAYQRRAPGLYMDKYTGWDKYERPGTYACEFQTGYFSHDGNDGKALNLTTAPTVLFMLKNFRFDRNHNIRLEVKHVTTKKGTIVRANTWGDSDARELEYSLLVIADPLG